MIYGIRFRVWLGGQVVARFLRLGWLARKPMARRSGVVAEDPRMRAYWTYHVDGQHKVPREGVRADHFYACSWCRPQPFWQPDQTYAFTDTEWEQFLLPAWAAAETNPLSLVAGRLG